MELFELQAKIADLEQQIAELPAGFVTKKTMIRYNKLRKKKKG